MMTEYKPVPFETEISENSNRKFLVNGKRTCISELDSDSERYLYVEKRLASSEGKKIRG